MSGRKVEEQKYAAPKRRKTESANGGIADWATAEPTLLARAIELVSKASGALRFGYTRDGGAYAVGVYENGQLNTEYIKPSEDLNEWLRGLIRDFEE